MRRVGWALIAVVGLVACSSNSPSAVKSEPTTTTSIAPTTSAALASSTTSGPAATTTSAPVSTAPGATVPATTTPPVTTFPAPPTATSACTHSRIKHVTNSYYGLPTPQGPSIDYRQSQLGPDAHDDRGNTIQAAGLSVQMTGPAGTTTLTHPAAGYSVVLRGWGDFDGDGRTDLLVDSGPEYATFIVLGSVGSGTHDPFVDGVRVPHPALAPGAFEAFAETVGDQNRDGADDVSFGPRLYSGRQLAVLPAGAPLPTPFRTLSAPYVGLLQIDANQPPSFVEFDRVNGALHVLDARADRLRLKATTVELQAAVNFGGRATGWLVGGQHIVQFDYGTRSGQTAWRWNLEAACGT